MKLRIPFHSRIERREEEDEREKMKEVVSSIKQETTISGRVGVLFQAVYSHNNEKWRFSSVV